MKKGPLVNLRGRKNTLYGPHISVPTFPLYVPRGCFSMGDNALLNKFARLPCQRICSQTRAQRGRRGAFWWQSGEMGHSREFKTGESMESLVEMVQIENSLRNYVNLASETGFLGLLKHWNPWASGGPWTPRTRGVESLTLNLLWKWYKLRSHYKITCEFYPDFYPHTRVFLGFWIAKTHDGVSGGQCMVGPMRIYCDLWN